MPDDLIVVEGTRMPVQELARLLNLLLEAERAGARVLAAYLDELPTKTAEWVGLHAVQRDEARERLLFLNRGQGWVAKRIAEALPRIAPSATRSALQEMHESHLANIALCEQLLV